MLETWSDESRDELHRQNRSDRRRGSSADIHTWMLWPVLGDDGLSPTSPPASASVKGVNKLAPLLLCAPCKPSSHRKNQNSTQWYVQQVKTDWQQIHHPFVSSRFLCFLVVSPLFSSSPLLFFFSFSLHFPPQFSATTFSSFSPRSPPLPFLRLFLRCYIRCYSATSLSFRSRSRARVCELNYIIITVTITII